MPDGLGSAEDRTHGSASDRVLDLTIPGILSTYADRATALAALPA